MEAKIQKLAVGVHDARNEMAKVQFELHLKITELKLREQPSTPLEVRKQHKAVVKNVVTAIDVAVVDCIVLFEQLMEALTSLQDEPNLQRLNTKSREL